MIYTHDGATWQTTLTTGETVRIVTRTDQYAGCTGQVIELRDGVVLVLLVDREIAFSPHELARPDGEPHITLIAGTPKVVNRPLKRRPTNFRGEPLKGVA